MAGAILVACAIAAIFAAGRQEAFQLLGTAGVFFASTYLVLFTIPLIAPDTPWWLRLTAASGLIVTAAFVVCPSSPSWKCNRQEGMRPSSRLP